MSVRWGIAGSGKMAETFAQDFQHVPDAVLVAVGSRRLERARDFAARHGIERAHGSYRSLIEDSGLDVLYVATPHPQHHALATAALEAGRAVLVEKAFTATLAGAVEIVELARAREVFAMEAMWTRFQPVVALARSLVEAGEIGEVRSVFADLGAFRAYDEQDRLFAPALGGGATLDLGVYVVSIAQHFLSLPGSGGVGSVRAVGRTYPNGADSTVSVILGYDDGRAATLFASLESETPGRAVIAGTGGSIELVPRFHHPSGIVVRRNGQPAESLMREPVGRGYCHEAIEVNRCLAEGLTESPVMPLDDTLVVMGVLEEVLGQLGITAAEDDSVL
jgi:predicted dehydrogenase